MLTLTVADLAKLRSETFRAERTIKNWARDPASVRPAVAEHLSGAARRLGIGGHDSSPPPAGGA